MGALSGIRVVDFSRVVAGPYCTMHLGDLGADVLKIEQPGKGDDTRGWGPPFVNGESTYFLCLNRNKKSICLDLHSVEGRDSARALIQTSDVLVENFRPGTMERLGLGYETLRVDNPRLIYCAISGFGQTGPRREQAGYDVAIQAMGGLMGITGTPDGPPVKTGVALIDVIAGLQASSGIIAALYHREHSGEGQRVEVSLLSAELASLINVGSAYLVAGQLPLRQGTAHASIVPYQVFATADGYLMVGAANDKLFDLFCREVGHPEWATDPRFATNANRVINRKTLIPMVEEALRQDTVDHWAERLGRAGVAVGPVNDLARTFADPQVVQSGQVTSVHHPTVGDVKMVGPALNLSATPAEVRLPPPRLGEHTDESLASLAKPTTMMGNDTPEM